MKTACPFCNSEFEVEQRFENHGAKCPSCGNDFIITPCEDDKPKLVAISPVKNPKFAASSVQNRSDKMLCPDCRRSISIFAETCPCCGHVFVDTNISTLLDHRASASVRDAPCRFDNFNFILCMEKCFSPKSRKN